MEALTSRKRQRLHPESPYRDGARALVERHRVVADALAEVTRALASLGRRRGRAERQGLLREQRRLLGEIANIERRLGEHGQEPAPPTQRLTRWFVAAVAIVLLASLGAARHSQRADRQHAFDPSAIDGADTIPRMELDGPISERAR